MIPRETILGLMVVVALVATSLVALRSTLEIWAIDSRNIKLTRVARGSKIAFFRNDTQDFQRAGHAIANLIFACAGGFVVHRFASHLGEVERNQPLGEHGI